MARDGTGTYTRTDGAFTGSTIFAQQYAAGQNINYLPLDNHSNDFATELTDSLSRSGKGAMLAALNFGGFRGVGISPGIARSDVAAIANVQDGTGKYAQSAGTGAAYTMFLSPAPAAYTTTTYSFRAHAANTGACTLNINGLGPLPIRSQNGASELAVSTIAEGDLVLVHYDSSSGGRFMFLASSRSSVFSTPVSVASGGTGATTVAAARANLLAASIGNNTDLTTIRSVLGVRAPAGQGLLLGANGGDTMVIDTGGSIGYGIAGADFNIYQLSGSNGALSLFGGSAGAGARLVLTGATHPTPNLAILTGNGGGVNIYGNTSTVNGSYLFVNPSNVAIVASGGLTMDASNSNLNITTTLSGSVNITSGGNTFAKVMLQCGGTPRLEVNAGGVTNLRNSLTATTVGGAGAGAALPANPTFYWRVHFDNTEFKIPIYLA